MKKICEISDVYSGLCIDNEKISYYTNSFSFKVLNTHKQSLITELIFDRDYSYKIIDNLVYFTCDDELRVFDFKSEAFSIRRTDVVKYVKAITPFRFIGISFHRKEKSYDNYILDHCFNVLWELKGQMSFRDIFDRHLLLSDKRGYNIAYLNFEDSKVLWYKNLDQGINGDCIETRNSIIIPSPNRLVAFKRSTGEELWEKEGLVPHYNYDSSNSKLYGLANKTLEVVNVDTGEQEMQIELNENIHILSHLTFYDNGLLYFSGYRDNNLPVVGAIEVLTGNVVFAEEVKMSGEKSFRKGLHRPFVSGNRLYIKDTLKNLHIFELQILAE